ncbi:MAG: hypothetical protein AAGA56_18210 [Myxococcota bacterium]
MSASILTTLALTAALIALIMVGMALGVILSNRRLQGSCGGASANCVCERRERGQCEREGDLGAAEERFISTALNRKARGGPR